MKGILDRSKNWLKLEECTAFDEINWDKVQVQMEDEKGGSTSAYFSTLSDEHKDEYRKEFEIEANALYRMLNGEVRSTKKVGEAIKNAINSGTFGTVFSTTMEVYILDYLRPQLIVSNLLANTIPVGPNINKSLIAVIRSFGQVKVSEVPRSGSLPIVAPMFAETADQIAYDIKKYGCKLEVEKEFANSDQWGMFGFLLTSIADAFRYRKELEVIKVINTTGQVMYDNASPSAGTFKVTTAGRAIDGTFNGTVALEDFIRTFAYMQQRGMQPQYILVHPFVLFNMYGDSELRAILGMSQVIGDFPMNAVQPGWDHPFGEDMAYRLRGMGGDNVASPTGNVPKFGEIGKGPLGIPGIDPHAQSLAAINMNAIMRANIPGYNVTVIASPLVPIKQLASGQPVSGNVSKFATNIYVVADKKPVAILQKTNPAPLEWEDFEREMNMLGFREEYCTMPIYQGRSVYIMKNVVIDKNYALPQRVYQMTSLTEVGGSALVS